MEFDKIRPRQVLPHSDVFHLPNKESYPRRSVPGTYRSIMAIFAVLIGTMVQNEADIHEPNHEGKGFLDKIQNT